MFLSSGGYWADVWGAVSFCVLKLPTRYAYRIDGGAEVASKRSSFSPFFSEYLHWLEVGAYLPVTFWRSSRFDVWTLKKQNGSGL